MKQESEKLKRGLNKRTYCAMQIPQGSILRNDGAKHHTGFFPVTHTGRYWDLA